MTDQVATNSVQELIRQIESKYIIIYVNKFTEESARAFYNDMGVASALGQEIVPVIIDSYGGACDSLLSMIDTVSNYPGKVATITMGKAMSCGSALLACGSPDMRFAYPNSRIMVHNVSAFTFGKVPEMMIEVKEAERLQKQLFQIMAKRCGQEKDYFLNLIKEHGNMDIFMTPEVAMKHKIIDHIKVPKFKVNVNINLSLM